MRGGTMSDRKPRRGARRLGLYGLVFFGVKGLLWLALPLLAAWLS